MYRFRFRVPGDDPRPFKFPPVGPFWCTGYGEDYCIVVAYAPDEETLTRKDHWPDAESIDQGEFEDPIQFNSRFQKPEWWEADSAEG